MSPLMMQYESASGFLRGVLDGVGNKLNRNSLIQSCLVVFALAVMFYLLP